MQCNSEKNHNVWSPDENVFKVESNAPNLYPGSHPAALSVISKSPCFKLKLFYLKVEFPNIIASTEHINMDLPKIMLQKFRFGPKEIGQRKGTLARRNL